MKIKYQFVNETVEIEVTEEWSAVIAELDRKEFNNNQTETRRHCSLDAFDQETEFGTGTDAFIDFLNEEEFRNVYECLSRLTERQRHLLIAVYMDRQSQTEIARNEGCSVAAINRALSRAKKSFIKIYQETVKNS